MAINHETPPEPVLEWSLIAGFAEIAKWGRPPHSCLPMGDHPPALSLWPPPTPCRTLSRKGRGMMGRAKHPATEGASS